MGTSHAAKVTDISQAIAAGKSPKQAIIEAIGPLDGVEVLSDLVLVGTYIRSERRASGIILPKESVGEDEFQSKAGLVLKCGPLAFAEWEENDEIGQNAKLHTWVIYAIKDGWGLTINGTPCRLVPYEKIRMRVTDPTIVY